MNVHQVKFLTKNHALKLKPLLKEAIGHTDIKQFFDEWQDLLYYDKGLLFFAIKDRKIIGLLAFLIVPDVHDVYKKKLTLVEIHWYILKEFRNSICALKLFRIAEKIAKEKKISSIIFNCHPDNKKLAKIYRRRGFKKTNIQYLKEF